MTEERAYPLQIRGDLSPDLSRWLWLVKWLLIIPHLIVLLVLSIVSLILTIVAFFAILFTGKYPRGMFNFNVNDQCERAALEVASSVLLLSRSGHGSLSAI